MDGRENRAMEEGSVMDAEQRRTGRRTTILYLLIRYTSSLTESIGVVIIAEMYFHC